MGKRGKLRTLEGGGLAWWCPACEGFHGFASPSRRWSFSGDYLAPTFAPSFVVEYRSPDGRLLRRCHSVVARGVVSYGADSSHALAGRSVPLPEPPDAEDPGAV